MSNEFLVITVALKQEIPYQWLKENGVPVFTISGLLSGVSATLKHSKKFCIVVTGVGPLASEKAAQVIMKTLNPAYIINYGTAGSLSKKHTIGTLVSPLTLTQDKKTSITLNQIHISWTYQDIKTIPELQTLNEAQTNSNREENKIVDMETYPQAHFFLKTGCKFQSIKTISDFVNSSSPTDFQNSLISCQENFKKLVSHYLEISPQISVIIPTYNRVDYLDRAIQSVLAQTYPYHELIIVDDGSTDTTQIYLNTLNHPKLKHILLTQNQGVSIARNRGASISTGNWLAFLDSDDEWYPTKLSDQVNFLKKHPYYNILQSEEIWVRNKKNIHQKPHQKKIGGWVFKECLERCFIAPSSVLIKKDLFTHVNGFPTNFPVCEDYALWLHISRHHLIGLVPTIGHTKYAGHPDQLSITTELDQYRVQALTELLTKEHNSEMKTLIKNEIEKKTTILINGALKRGHTEKAKYYKKLMME